MLFQVQILPLIILPHSLPSKETQKVACISDPENAKTVAGTVLMTAPTTVFWYSGLFLPQKAGKSSFALVDKRGFFDAKECVNGAEVRVRERKSNIAQCFKQNPCVFDVT